MKDVAELKHSRAMTYDLVIYFLAWCGSKLTKVWQTNHIVGILELFLSYGAE